MSFETEPGPADDERRELGRGVLSYVQRVTQGRGAGDLTIAGHDSMYNELQYTVADDGSGRNLMDQLSLNDQVVIGCRFVTKHPGVPVVDRWVLTRFNKAGTELMQRPDVIPRPGIMGEIEVLFDSGPESARYVKYYLLDSGDIEAMCLWSDDEPMPPEVIALLTDLRIPDEYLGHYIDFDVDDLRRDGGWGPQIADADVVRNLQRYLRGTTATSNALKKAGLVLASLVVLAGWFIADRRRRNAALRKQGRFPER